MVHGLGRGQDRGEPVVIRNPLDDLARIIGEASERMIVPPSNVIMSERVAAVLVSNGARLSDRVVVLLLDGSNCNGLDFAGTRPDPVIHIDTPKPLGKRAKRRARGRS